MSRTGGIEIQVLHHIDSGGGTIRSTSTGHSLGISVGMVEELAPRRRPAGFRWYRSESIGGVTLTYGFHVKSNLLRATILGAPMSAVVNLAAAPSDEALLLTVARALASSACTYTRVEPTR